MSRRDSLTRDLFEVPTPITAPASMDLRAVVSALVGSVLKGADGDRYSIAANVSRLCGKDVSKYMLDAYSSEGREEFNLPLWIVPALEISCNTYVLSQWLAEARGGRLLVGRETLTAELGKFERIRDQAARQIRELKKILGEEAI